MAPVCRPVLLTTLILEALAVSGTERGTPILWKSVAIPDSLLASHEHKGQTLRYGGDVRIGDLTGDGQIDFVVFRSTGNAMKPCFLAAFTMEGKVLWRAGKGGTQPARPGPVALHDIDGDGRTEVVCFFIDPARKAPPGSMADVVVQIRDGATGRLEHQAAPPALLYNGGMLWKGTGQRVATLPGLPPLVGPPKMGWYHCIPADLCGDARDELVLYNPWDRRILLYTPAPLDPAAYRGYRPGPRQYNARLMD